MQVWVPSLNKSISVDCAFGGMIYAIVDIDRNSGLPPIQPQNGKTLAKLGEEIKVDLHQLNFQINC